MIKFLFYGRFYARVSSYYWMFVNFWWNTRNYFNGCDYGAQESELQESLRRYTLMERLSLRMDVARWVLLSGSGVAVGSYSMFANYEIVISGVMRLLQIVP
jgi:hypothetical protein